MGDYERVRLVTLGGPNVGKSSIVKRFMFNTFTDKYKPTVEDLYSQEYDFGSLTLKVDVLDTAGDLQFPAMRRLSIATAHAFLIVYSVGSRESFELAKVFFNEISEQRGDFQETPIVLAGNKMDLDGEEEGTSSSAAAAAAGGGGGRKNVGGKREVYEDEVSDWLEGSWPELKVKAAECSAKDNKNIREIFRNFLTLSKLSFDGSNDDGSGLGLKRRSSAHAGSKSPAPPTSTTPVASRAGSISGGISPGGPSSSSGLYAIHHHHTSSSSSGGGGHGTPPKTPTSPSPNTSTYQHFLTEESALANCSRNKPRSRSLIRKNSKKVKQQVRDASTGPGDCQMS